MEKQPLLNTYVSNLNCQEAVAQIERLIEQRKPAYVVEVNTDVVMKIEHDAYLKKITDEADLTLVDGKPLVWISRLQGHPVKERVAGSDLTLGICKQLAQKGQSCFILGGKEGVAAEAKKNLETRYPGILVKGVYAPPMGFEKNEEELRHIRALISDARPDLVLACLGCPKQEKWIYENYLQMDAAVYLCAGATVDFLAGNVRRCPRWMSQVGLEWFFRFLMEPKRLFKRYFVDDMKVIMLIFKYRRTGRERV